MEEYMPTATFTNLPEEKQERILQAAAKEFGKRNVQEGILSNIVKDAGISRGSLYQYFPSKADLYIHVFETLRARRAEYVKPAYALFKKESFLLFFKNLYLLDSEYLLRNPLHIAMGQQLYSNAHSVSRGLIQRMQNRYQEIFVIGIDFDKEQGVIDPQVNTWAMADLCVHFVTDIFIFQSINSQLSLGNIRDYIEKTLYIIENGIKSA